MIQVYLLAVRGLRRRMEEIASTGGTLDAAVLPGWDKLTDWQQEKVSSRAKPGPRALCMGGQLLLQYGAYERLQSEQSGEMWHNLSYPRLLESIPAPLPLQIAYESKGKPYVLHVPWHYNLSHSGDYVALAMGDAPVGIDIQQKRSYTDSLLKRFFSEAEAAAYESLCSADVPEQNTAKENLFYTLWCRKEAYGKLLGTGLTEDVLKRNMLEDVGVHLYEYGELPGYCVCVCSEEG